MKLLRISRLLSLVLAFSQPDYGSFEDAGHTVRDGPTHDLPEVARLSFLHSETVFRPRPESRLVIYVQTFTTREHRPLSLLPLLDYETKVTHVILASLHLHDQPGVIKLNYHDHDHFKWDQIWDEVKILQRAGIKVMTLLGGAATGTYSKLTGTEEEPGREPDIEEEVPISVPLRILNAFYRDMGPSFIMTMSPLSSALISADGQNPSGFSYFSLDELTTVPGSDRKLVSWYNAMFYGHFPHGPPPYQDVTEKGWEPNLVVMGVLCSPDDGQPNTPVHIKNMMERIKDLREVYPDFGGVARWEYYDAGNEDGMDGKPWEWVREVGKAFFYIWHKREL